MTGVFKGCAVWNVHFLGSSKRDEAHSKSSNLVVNSVALSRDLPVVTVFYEIICYMKYNFA